MEVQVTQNWVLTLRTGHYNLTKSTQGRLLAGYNYSYGPSYNYPGPPSGG